MVLRLRPADSRDSRREAACRRLNANAFSRHSACGLLEKVEPPEGRTEAELGKREKSSAFGVAASSGGSHHWLDDSAVSGCPTCVRAAGVAFACPSITRLHYAPASLASTNERSPMPTPIITRRRLGTVAAVAVLASLGLQSPAQAASVSYHRNADPTTTSISSVVGPEKVHKTRVLPSSVKGFGGGTIFYPTNTQGKTVGAVVLTPGFTSKKDDLSWYGPALAFRGFIVFGIDTLDPADFPDARTTELVAAVDFLKKDKELAQRLDPTRVAVAGYSMGGGAALKAATNDPEISAVLAYAPFYIKDDGSSTSLPVGSITSPTLIVTGEKDDVAPAKLFGRSFYDGLAKGTPRQYVQLKGADHDTPEHKNTDILSTSVAFLKTFVDKDERYAKFIFPAPQRPSLTTSLSAR